MECYMLLDTCQNNIDQTLEHAFNSAQGQLRTMIHNARQKIMNIFQNYSDRIHKIKSKIKAILQTLKIYSGTKRKIEKYLNKLK